MYNKYKDAKYTAADPIDGLQAWEVTYANGVKETIFNSMKTEQETLVADAKPLEFWT